MATPALRRKETFYRPELDALRFIAFLAVFVTHTLPDGVNFYLAHHLPRAAGTLLSAISVSGHFGVGLFFMLSSYLITSLLLRERQRSGAIDLKAFYVRRILRIWPLYFFALGLAAFWPDPAFRMPPHYLLAFLLLAGNWMTVFHGPSASFASILWSVSVEEQFYLSWPLLMKAMKNKKAVLGLCGTLIVIANLCRVYLYLTPHEVGRIYENTLAQLDTIAIGALLAVVGLPAVKTVGARIAVAAASWTTIVACGWYESNSRTFVLFGYSIVIVGCAGLLVAANGLSLPASSYFVRLGKISYGLYVYHKLALLLVALSLHLNASTLPRYAVYTGGGFLLTILFAEASYRWLETPFLRLKERYTVVASRPV